MTDLSNIAGFSVLLDDENGISFGEERNIEEYRVPLGEIVPVLLNKYLKYPETVYRFHPKVKISQCDGCEFSYNMIYIPYGLLGVEFMKTHIFYSDYVENKYDALVEVFSGSLSVIIQRNGECEDEWDTNTYVEDLRVVHLTKGDRIAIPTGVYYTFANTGLKPAVFSMVISGSHRRVDYENLKKERGLACFIISKNSKVATVANPKYKIRKKLVSSSLNKLKNDQKFVEIYCKPFVENNIPLINFMERVEDLKRFFY